MHQMRRIFIIIEKWQKSRIKLGKYRMSIAQMPGGPTIRKKEDIFIINVK